MEFLKGIFNDKALTFDDLVQAINAHNGNEANKDKQIKLANLGGGEYVGKGKYDSEIEKLNNLLSGKSSELEKANGLIAELQKATKGNEEMQGKFTEYQNQVAQLQQQLQDVKIKSAVKVALLAEKANDIPYLSFKLDEKLKGEGKSLELDENENIKGWDDLLSGLKTQFPTQFDSASNPKVDPNPLPTGDNRETAPTSLADALRMQYEGK